MGKKRKCFGNKLKQFQLTILNQMTAETMTALIHAIPPIISMSANVYVSEMITFQRLFTHRKSLLFCTVCRLMRTYLLERIKKYSKYTQNHASPAGSRENWKIQYTFRIPVFRQISWKFHTFTYLSIELLWSYFFPLITYFIRLSLHITVSHYLLVAIDRRTKI